MKTLQQINSSLEAFQNKYGMALGAQGSEAWLKMKLGVLSASNASKIVAAKSSETRLTYMSELVAQVCTGETEEFNNKYVEYGKAHEEAARSSYEFSEGVTIEQVSFVFKDDNLREGCSPDGILQSQKKGIEIKVPYNAANYIKFFVNEKAKKEYDYQVQYSIRVLGCEKYDLVQYCPTMRRNPIKVLEVERDEKIQDLFEDACGQFIHDMDLMLEKIGVSFGEQWS